MKNTLTTASIFIILFLLNSVAALGITPEEFLALRDQSRVRLQSVNDPDRYVHHQDFKITQSNNDGTTLFLERATFKVVEGLSDPEGVSFESTNFPNHYIHHRNFQLFLDPDGNTNLFDQRATFKVVEGLAGHGSVSFESINFTNHYIHYRDSQLFLDSDDNTNFIDQDASFNIVIENQWGPLQSWPLIPLHMLTLPDGKVLSFGTNESGMQGAQFIFDVYDPENDTHYTLPNPLPTDIFCSHMALDPNSGNVLIFGGDARKSGPGGALDGVNMLTIFNPKTFELSASPVTMKHARWYPSVVTLSNGEILTVGGRNDNKDGSSIPEVWDGNSFRELTDAEITDMVGNPEDSDSLDETWWYPHVFQRSNGEVVVIEAWGDDGNDVYIMTTEGTGTVRRAGRLDFLSHKMDPSLMYDVDKVLMVDIEGGLWSADLSPDIPTYTKVGQMPDGRTAANMNVLPDGSVVITGGTAPR